MVSEYLGDEHFGQLAATVLADQWSETNEPSDNARFPSGVDFTRVSERRAARAASPSTSSAEADAIFAVIDALVADEATSEKQNLAVALGIVALRLPHGRREPTIKRLIALASRQARASLLLSLILSGEDVGMKLVVDGIAETFDAAKKETWILTQSDAYELRAWLRLLPFANPVSEIPTIVRGLPDAQRTPRLLEEMVRGLGDARSADAEATLFKLAEDDPRFYLNDQWRTTVLRLGSVSSARRVIDLTVKGMAGRTATGDSHWLRQLGALIVEFPEVKSDLQELLKGSTASEPTALLAYAVAEAPDTEGLLMLIDLEIKTGRRFLSQRSIENVVTEHLPSENWKGAFEVVPVPATELRRKLLALSSGTTDPAARCLAEIDEIRDRYGTPETEPRHPDLASGRPWPILPHN